MCIRDRDYHISKNDKNLVVVESKQARKFAIQEINKSDLKYDIVVADEFKESQVSSYDNVIFVADAVSYTHLDVYKRQSIHIMK